jgi:hypothetical protein
MATPVDRERISAIIVSYPTMAAGTIERNASSRGLRPDFMRDEIARVPDYFIQLGTKDAVFGAFDPAVAATA